MKSFYFIFTSSLLLLSCSLHNNKATEIQNTPKTDTPIIISRIFVNDNSTDTPIILSKEIIDSTPFLNDYIEGINFDSTLTGQAKSIVINHKPIEKGYLLPSKYILDDDTRKKNPFISYTQTQINIGSNKIFINNSKINPYLDSGFNQVKKYGVLLIDKEKIQIVKDSLELQYSYSIPYTDLGTEVINHCG
jgi:hypothetical protein